MKSSERNLKMKRRKRRSNHKRGLMKRQAVAAFCDARSFDTTTNGFGAKLISQCWAYHILKDCSEIERLQQFDKWQKYIQRNLNALIRAAEEEACRKVNRFIRPGKTQLEWITFEPTYQELDSELEHIKSKGRRVETINRCYSNDIKARKPEMLIECGRRITKLLLGGTEIAVVINRE